MSVGLSRLPRHVVLDDFLDQSQHLALLSNALGSEDSFVATQIGGADVITHNPGFRRSWRSTRFGGEVKALLRAAVVRRFDEIREQVGVPVFEPERIELELAAHRDGSFYRPHVDTATGESQEADGRDRMVTMVYYFHRQPRRFSGGEIALYPFVPGAEPVLIEPADNRLIAFPSLAIHEVRPVSCPGDAWADARFAVNIWFSRQRSPEHG